MNFVSGLLFLTALVLFHQSDYLNHYNNDSDRLIVACFMRLSTEQADDTVVCFGKRGLFLKLKIMRGEFNGFFILKQIEKP